MTVSIALIVVPLGQLVGLVPSGRTDGIGRLTGLLCGVGYI